MNIATMLLTHNNPELTKDTADSINFWMTKDIMIIVDGAGWNNFNSSFPYPLYKGLVHGKNRSPYKNILYGLLELYKRFPRADWYCYIESDVLVISDGFKSDLKLNANKSIGGLNYRGGGRLEVPLLNEIVEDTVKQHHYLIGATQFMSKKFVEKIISNNLPNKILKLTESFPSDHFPNMPGYAVEEELFPILANYYDSGSVFLMGEFAKYPVRWKPDIEQSEISAKATIVHPIKDEKSPIRLYYQTIRKKLEKFRK